MGNRKFRFSDMIPNAWFHKLQEIGKGRSQSNPTPSNSNKKLRQPPPPSPQSKQNQQLNSPPPPPPPLSSSRKSYHFSRDLQSNDGFYTNSPPPPSLPPKKLPKQQKLRLSSPDSFHSDIVIDVSSKYSNNVVDSNFDSHSKPDLRPIITKRKEKKAEQRTAAAASRSKKSPSGSPGGVRVRNQSPRIGQRKIRGRRSTPSRRSFSGSMAVRKSSCDPEQDFRESMVEMIVENDIRSLNDLEDLLACYLCLNAHEYHHVIIHVFKQIWFHLSEPPL